MNRRSFFKVVTGFVAGAVSAKAKSETLICKGKGGTLCPRCKFNEIDDTKAIQEAIDLAGKDGGVVDLDDLIKELNLQPRENSRKKELNLNAQLLKIYWTDDV